MQGLYSFPFTLREAPLDFSTEASSLNFAQPQVTIIILFCLSLGVSWINVLTVKATDAGVWQKVQECSESKTLP